MAVDPFRMLGGGDPMPRSATTFNAMLRAASEVRLKDADRLTELIRRTPQATVVQVRNATADPVDQFGILGIDRPNFLPDANENEFRRRVHLRGLKPTAAHLGRFVILLEPLAPGSIGKAVISGITACRIYFPPLQDGLRFADADPAADDTTGGLIAKAHGPAQILWAESPFDGGSADGDPESTVDGGIASTVVFADTIDGGLAEDDPQQNTRWSIVRLGNDTRGERFDVLCTIDGGSAGSLTATCDWTYSVTTMDGVQLGANLSPTRRRLTNTPYTTTPDDTIGQGAYDLSGEFVLRDANETIKTHPCEESKG